MPLKWDFEARQVAFSLSLEASFLPSLRGATVSIPWLDATGWFTSEITIPLGSAPGAPEPGPGGGGGAKAKGDAAAKARASKAGKEGERLVQVARSNTKSMVPKDLPLDRNGRLQLTEQRDLGTFPVTLDLVRAVQNGVLPVTVALPPKPTGEPGAEAPRLARLHLGPLLLGKVGRDGGEADLDSCQVSAVGLDSMSVAGLHRLQLRISTAEPLLSRGMQQRLLPTCFTLRAIQGLPNEAWLPQKCENVYTELYPKLASATTCIGEECKRVRSASKAHNSAIRFEEPVVWLLGAAEPHAVREWLQHGGLVVEVHDRDLRAEAPSAGAAGQAEEAPPAQEAPPIGKKGLRQAATQSNMSDTPPLPAETPVEHHHGVAQFWLGDLVASAGPLAATLRASVVPARGNKKRRREEASQKLVRTQGLLDADVEELTTIDKFEETALYQDSETVCILKVEMAAAVPRVAQIQDVQARESQPAGEVKLEGNIWAACTVAENGKLGPALPGGPWRAKVSLPSGAEACGPWRDRREVADADEQRLAAALAASSGAADEASALAVAAELEKEAVDAQRHERYGRVVIRAEEKDFATVSAILEAVRRHNADALGLDSSSAQIATYSLSEEEKANAQLDIVTGFAVLDGRQRAIVVEGLRGRGLRKVLEAIPGGEDRGNGGEFRLIHNAAIGFSERLYADFGLTLKQIKIRTQLKKLASRSELYSRAGCVDEDGLAGMEAPKLLCELLRAQRMRQLRHDGCWPRAGQLLNLEILYGSYVTDEELAGQPPLQKKGLSLLKSRKTGLEALSASVPDLRNQNEETVTTIRFAETQPRRAALDQTNPASRLTLSSSVPDFRKVNREKVAQMSEEVVKANDLLGKKRDRETPFLDGVGVHLYSGQKLNSAELQKEWMRKNMEKEWGQKIYTYSENYNGATFNISGKCEPGGPEQQQSSRPNNTCAQVEGDTRPPWRPEPARPKEDFRKPGRDLGPARPEELHEAFLDGEWFQLAAGKERRRPVASHSYFDAEKLPHHRRVTERPFDAALEGPRSRGFGPKSGYESVHYHGRRPGEDLYSRFEQLNREEAALHASKILDKTNPQSALKTWSKGATRNGVTSTDRCEQVLKDKPARQHTNIPYEPAPVTIRTLEAYHDVGNPQREWHARLRENDSNSPYDATTGAHLPRDPKVGQKVACMSGTLGPAPWRHHDKTGGRWETAQSGAYVSTKDFDVSKKPPTSRWCEGQVSKNATRADIGGAERGTHGAYRRPGVQASA